MSRKPSKIMQAYETRLRGVMRSLMGLTTLIHAQYFAGRNPVRLIRFATGLSRRSERVWRALEDERRKADMLADPEWRGRVVRELGGETRLEAWDVQRQKSVTAKNSAAPDPPARAIDFQRIKAQERAQFFTSPERPDFIYDRMRCDRMGQFRLSPIARRGRARKRVPIVRRPVRSTGRRYVTPHLIGVRPQEFRRAQFADLPKRAVAFDAPVSQFNFISTGMPLPAVGPPP